MHTGVLRLGTRHTRKYELKLWSPKETAYHGKVMKSVYQIVLFKDGLPEPKISDFPSEIKVDIPDGRITSKDKTKKI